MRTARIGLGRLLRRINRLALGAAVGLVAVVVLLTSFALGLAALVETSRAQARVLAENASAALAFDDKKAAPELLRSLRTSPDVPPRLPARPRRRAFAGYAARPAARRSRATG